MQKKKRRKPSTTSPKLKKTQPGAVVSKPNRELLKELRLWFITLNTSFPEFLPLVKGYLRELKVWIINIDWAGLPEKLSSFIEELMDHLF